MVPWRKSNLRNLKIFKAFPTIRECGNEPEMQSCRSMNRLLFLVDNDHYRSLMAHGFLISALYLLQQSWSMSAKVSEFIALIPYGANEWLINIKRWYTANRNWEHNYEVGRKCGHKASRAASWRKSSPVGCRNQWGCEGGSHAARYYVRDYCKIRVLLHAQYIDMHSTFNILKRIFSVCCAC